MFPKDVYEKHTVGAARALEERMAMPTERDAESFMVESRTKDLG